MFYRGLIATTNKTPVLKEKTNKQTILLMKNTISSKNVLQNEGEEDFPRWTKAHGVHHH